MPRAQKILDWHVQKFYYYFITLIAVYEILSYNDTHRERLNPVQEWLVGCF